jgi:hypothetical protein
MRDAVLEEPMLLRQQLEGSALPNEFKRAHFISPYWDEILLDVNRTIQVTKGGKVSSTLPVVMLCQSGVVRWLYCGLCSAFVVIVPMHRVVQ